MSTWLVQPRPKTKKRPLLVLCAELSLDGPYGGVTKMRRHPEKPVLSLRAFKGVCFSEV